MTGTGVGTPAASPTPLVEFRRVSKAFGTVVACDTVDLALRTGEVHGLLGENGAGKSTLMNMLIGLVLPDAGSTLVRGEQQRITDPAVAGRLGIGMVHQHLSLVEPLTVWENVLLGEKVKLDRAAARDLVAAISDGYGLDVDPDVRVSDLTAGVRQRVEIIKCLRRDPTVLVFDEPTSLLTPAESEQLFDTLRRVVEEEGKAVALVSHKLDEVMQASDWITIMRAGRVIDGMPAANADPPTLAHAMVGRPVSLRAEGLLVGNLGEVVELLDEAPGSAVLDPGEEPAVLRLDHVSATGSDGRVALDDLSLDVRPGEIVGVAGVEGNGQRALTELFSSLLALDSGRVEVDGRTVRAGRPGAMAEAGIGVIPEDRHDQGCVLDMTVAENLFLAHPERVARRGVIDTAKMRRWADVLIGEFDIVTPSPDAPMWSLSGGNQQRVVLARELSHDPKLLVAAQPTRGLDVGAVEYVTNRLVDAADQGVGVLLISSELEEILALSHRIVVLFRGRIVGQMARSEIDLERLGLLMGGAAA